MKAFSGERAYLSNMAPVRIRMSGLMYSSVEAAYQAAKFPILSEHRDAIAAMDGYAAKRYAREHRADWREFDREAVMKALLAEKFSRPDYAMRLKAENDPIVERNGWHDQFWGDCECGRAACAERGLNRLGEMLMLLRASIR